MKKNIFLAGGANENNLKEFNNFFLKQLKEQNIKKVYFIPFGKKRFLFEKAFQKTAGFFKRRVDIKLIRTVEELVDIDKKVKTIALYMPGGNAMRYINIIRGGQYYGIFKKTTKEDQVLLVNPNKINIEKYLRNFVKNGGFYYGTSAGAILAGKSLNTHMLETANEIRERGLNLIDDQSVAPHYEDWQKSFYNSQEQELKTKIIRLKEQEGFYYNEEIYILKKNIKEKFIKRQIKHTRLVQDLMILLEINKDKLPFLIRDNWKILNRGIVHDMDKFQEFNVNQYVKIKECRDNKRSSITNDYIDEKVLYSCPKNHSLIQKYHTKYHKKNNKPFNNIDICELCCDIFANSLKNKDNTNGKQYCLNEFFPNTQFLKEYQDSVIKILDLLSLLY